MDLKQIIKSQLHICYF